MQGDLAQRVNFVLERPLAVAGAETGKRHSCTGTASYRVSDDVLAALRRAESDAGYQTRLWQNWRWLLGLSSADDLARRAAELDAAAAKSEDEQDVLREELAQILNIDEHVDPTALPAEIRYYLEGPARHREQEIRVQRELLAQVLESRDKRTGLVRFPVHYTMSATDQPRRFDVSASADDNVIKAIRLLETLQSSAPGDGRKRQACTALTDAVNA